MTAFEPKKSLQNCFLSSESRNLTVRESFARYVRYFQAQKYNFLVSIFREIPSGVTSHTQFIHVFVDTDETPENSKTNCFRSKYFFTLFMDTYKRQENSESQNLRQ